MKRVNNVFEKIVDKNNIIKAIHYASKRKKKRKSVQKILANEEYYADQIIEMLKTKSYTPSPYIVANIFDGSRKKERTIYKPRFYPDQVIHWALMLQIETVLKKRFYFYSCASIKGRGTKHAIKGIKKAIKSPKSKYCLKMDIKKFYPSVNKEKLKSKFRRVFKDNDLLWLIDTIIDGNPNQGLGIPIGNYTSQWFANFYLTDLDNYIKENLKVKYYIRYMDDLIIFRSNKRELWKIKECIENYLKAECLTVKENWQNFQLKNRPLDFVGYRFYKDHTTLRRSNFLRVKRRVKKIFNKGYLNYTDACAFISYHGLIRHSDCNNYIKKYIRPFISFRRCRKVVSNENRKQYLSKTNFVFAF